MLQPIINKTRDGSRGPDPLRKLAEQAVVRKVRFCCKATIKYVPKMSYFALKSSKIVSFCGLRPQSAGLPAPIASSGR